MAAIVGLDPQHTAGAATSTALPKDFNYSLLAGAESFSPNSTSSPLTASVSEESSSSSSSEEENDHEGGHAGKSGKGKGVDADARVVGGKVVRPYGGANKVMPQDPNDWLWMHTEEPHRSRRRAILKAHPEVTKLMGYSPLTKYVVLLVVSIQFLTCYLLRNTSPLSPIFVLAAYLIGGTANQNLFLAIHEITHNLAFRGIKQNRLFAMFANLPIGIPYAMMFKKYHMEHHRALGVDGVDTDLPTRAELMILKNVAGKAFFCTFQILFYALRPGFVRSQKLTRWHALNFSTQILFDILLLSLHVHFSPSPLTTNQMLTPLYYLIMSSFFAGSLHPCAGHFIAEHYLWDNFDQETWSYYGILNSLTYNVGYHNEHHDFPSVPWTRLPELKAMAPEFYDHLPQHKSWVMVTYRFIFESNVGLFSRAKRVPAKDKAAELEGVEHAGGKGDLGGMKDD